MRYEDASHTGAFQGSGPIANDDLELIAAGSKSSATGNLITGEGTQSGAAGADSAAGAHITAIAGKGGEDTSFSGGKLSVAGDYGKLSVDADGNYVYEANKGVENVRDRFTYTLADNQGASDTASLIVEIGKTPVVIKANAQQIVPGPDGVVTLPPGVELSDVHVVGRNLVIDLPDGTQLVIIDGAVFVPQLVIDGVSVPATNVAALLVGQEIQPAAGETPPSGGGNFALPPPPLDPGVPLGDLIPPTEYDYTPPGPDEVFDSPDDEPEAGAANAILDDDAQAGGIAGGVGDDPGSDVAVGSLPGSDGDGDLTWALLPSGTLPAGFTFEAQLNGDVWIMQGGVHVVTVSVDPATGAYTVTQVAAIDHSAGGDENNLDLVIEYSVTDEDGDSDIGTLTINVDDDTPVVSEVTARGGVTLDETDAGTPAGFPISDTTSGPIIAGAVVAFGADGPAAANSVVYGISVTDANSGLATAIGDHPITLVQIDGDTIQGQYQDGGTQVAFIIQMNPDGSVTLTQNVPLEHLTDGPPGPAHDDSLDLSGKVSATVTITDGDGDTASGSAPIGGNLIFKDDGPSATVNEQAELDSAVLDETRPEGTDTPGGNSPNGDASEVLNFADNFLAADYGADGAGTTTYQLLLSANGIGSGLYALEAGDTSDGDGDGYGQGDEITLSQSGNTITGSANGVNYFTITINPATGEVTFTQLNPIWHPDPADQDETATLNTEVASDIQVQQTVTDSDGDTDTAQVDIGRGVFAIQDDAPDAFEECPDEVISVNDPNADPFTGSLNLPDVGEDEPGVVTFGVSDGDPVLDTEGNPVTSGEDALFYFINEDGVLEARAGDENGELIFTITLNGDGTFTYDQIGQIGEGGTISFENLTSTSAGNAEFRGVGADDPTTTVDLLLSAEDAGADATVNTDSDSIGAANQSMDDGETVRIDFVSDLTSGAGTPSGFGYSGHVSSSSFIGLIPQVQGDQSQTVAFTVWALDSNVAQGTEPDRNPAGGFSDSTITAITEVTVKDYLTGNSTTVDVTGFTVGVFTPVAYGISARVNADGSVTFSGIQQGDSYGFSTGAGDFNAVAVQSDPAGTGGSTQDSFDLGVFSIGVANEFEPVDLQVPIVVTDADGDPVVCDIDIHIGVPLEADDITVTVNEAGLPLIGSDSASNSETQGGDLQGQVSGGTGPYTFAFAPGEDGNGAYGTLTLNPDGTFSYTLETPFDSQPDADDGTNPELAKDSFQVVATDSLGATQTLTIKVNIIDDVPTAVDDTDSIAAGQYGPVDGNVITDASAGDVGDSDAGADTKGADGAVVVGVAAGDTNADLDNPATVGVVIQGTYGKLTLNSDGSYSYTRDPGTDGGVQDVFTYTIEDGDGDRSNATLTITIADSPPTIDAPDQGEAGTVVDEKGLPTRGESPGTGEFADGNGNDNDDTSETTAGVINFTAPDGPAIIRIDGVVVTGVIGQTFAGSHGTLTITSYDAGTGQIGYSYTLADNTSGDATFDDFAIQIEDQDGDLANDTLVIDIIDDEPLASNDVDSVVGGFDPATGNVLTGVEVAIGEDANGTDGVADNPGADGGRVTSIDHAASPAEAVPNGGSTDIQGTYGVLTIYSNGDYSYQRDPGTPGGVEDVFTYTLTDGDGDSTTATLTIGIDDNFPTLPDPDLVRLDDDVIPGANGNLDGPGDDNPDTVPGNVVNGSLVGSGGDGDLDYNFTGTNTLPSGFSIGAGSDADTLLIVQDQNGSPVTVMTIQLNIDTGAFTVTQNAPIWHPADNGGPDDNIENNLTFSIGVEVEDADGDTEPATITINVDDDTPTIDVTKGDDSAVTLTTDDAQTIGGASDTAVSTANFSGVFGLTQSAGADGTAAAATLQFALDVTGYTGGPAGVNSGLESHDADIFLYEIGGKVVGSTSATLAGVDATNTVFDVGVASDGVVTLTQYQQIDHDTADPTPTGSPFADHIVSLSDGLVTLTAAATLTDRDGDTVTDSETANIGANLRFTDDGPSAAIAETGQTVSVDESVGVQVDSNDTTAPAVIALFAGVANVGTDTDLPQYAQNASAVVNSVGSAYGADGAGTTAFSLNVSSAGVDSGLNTTSGQDILLYKEGNLIVGRVSGGPDDGKAALAIAIDPVTGVVSTVEYLSIYHPNSANPDDSVSIADGAVLAVVTVTDFDGDTATQQVGIGSAIQFQDSAPVMTAVQNMNIQNSGDVANTAQFAFNLGADGANTSNDVITNVTGSATVGGVPVTNWVLNPVSENATTASYSFSFTYGIGGGNTANASGTLVFDKVAGTYTIDLANPIQGVTTILQTAQGTLFQGYQFGTSTPDGSQPEISVTQIQDLAGTANDIYVQFTSVSEPSSGTGDDNLEVTNWVPGADNPAPVDAVDGGGDTSWSAGQLFNQEDGWVSTSNSANGVDGDTIQGGEVLDFSLVQGANPTGVLAAPSTYAQASAMFLKFDGIGSAEDMIVILKLYDPNTNTYTTRAVMIENADIQKGPGAGPGQYSGITLDNNDGLVIIESNDYNNPGENWVIVGAQIAGSDEGVTGTAINLNGAIGAGDSDVNNDGSLDTQSFATDTDNGPFKISSIGFLTTQTTPQNAQLDFNVTVTDGDGDSITQAITATVTAAADSTSAATVPAGNTTINSNLPGGNGGSGGSGSSNLAFSNDNGPSNNGNGNDKNLTLSNVGNTGILAGIIAAAGLSSSAAATTLSPDYSFDAGVQDLVSTSGLQAFQQQSLDSTLSSLSLDADLGDAAFDFSALQGSGLGFTDFREAIGSLDAQSFGNGAPAYEPSFAVDQAPSFDASAVTMIAPSVGMPSAEALQALNLEGVQQGGSVEQILADALGNGAAPTVDAVLDALSDTGGIADLASITNVTSPVIDHVSGWDMGMAGAFGAGNDMMFKMDVASFHQDAVQPTVNG